MRGWILAGLRPKTKPSRWTFFHIPATGRDGGFAHGGNRQNDCRHFQHGEKGGDIGFAGHLSELREGEVAFVKWLQVGRVSQKLLRLPQHHKRLLTQFQ
jgi:hypothetical protein